MTPPKKRIGEMSRLEQVAVIAAADGWQEVKLWKPGMSCLRPGVTGISPDSEYHLQDRVPDYFINPVAIWKILERATSNQYLQWCKHLKAHCGKDEAYNATSQQKAHCWLLTLGHEE